MSSDPITGAFNDGYVTEAYEAYRRDPASVDESWRQFFRFAESIAGASPPAAVLQPSAAGQIDPAFDLPRVSPAPLRPLESLLERDKLVPLFFAMLPRLLSWSMLFAATDILLFRWILWVQFPKEPRS